MCAFVRAWLHRVRLTVRTPYRTFDSMTKNTMGAVDEAGQAPTTGAIRTDAVTRQLTSLRTKLFYGLGSIAFGVKDNGFQTILLLFYNQVVGLPGQWVGGGWGIG